MESATVAPHIDEAAWLERRKQLVTASAAAAPFGDHPFITPELFQARKLGLAPDPEVTVPMERGRIFEPLAVERYEQTTGRRTRRIPFRVHPEHPLIGATADRRILASDDAPTGVLEVKVPFWRTFSEIKRNGLPPYMIYQAQLEAAVWGYDETTMAVWDTQSLELLTFPVPADPVAQEGMIQRLEEWWHRHIVNREPVQKAEPLEKLPAVEGMVTHRSDLAFERAMRDYLEARDVAKEAGLLQKQAGEQLKGCMAKHGVYEGGPGRVYYQEFPVGNKKHSDTVAAIRGLQPIDPFLLQVALGRKLSEFPGLEEQDALEILAAIADDVRLDIDALEVRGKGYEKVQVYRVTQDAEAF